MKTNMIITFFTDIFYLPLLIRTLYERREVIRLLTWRDFLARYRGSLAGMLWSIFQPLLMMAIYTLVFSSFLKVRFGNSDSPFVFALYLLCGLLPWNSFAEGLSQSTNVIRSNANLVKRVVFPLEILPLILTLIGLLQQLIGTALLLPLALWVTKGLGWAILFLPLLLFAQFLLVTGANWIWASLSVFIPDLRHVTPAVITILLFSTPILYPENLVPDWAAWVVRLNPIAHLVRMTRGLVMDNTLPSVSEFGWTTLVCLVVFLVGYRWFMYTKSTFADLL